MPLQRLVDAEGLVIAYLRTQADLVALAGESGAPPARVWSWVPGDATYPLVTVVRVGGSAIAPSSGNWLDNPRLQLDSWGSTGNKGQAQDVIATVQAALHLPAMFAPHALGIVTDVQDLVGPVEQIEPDEGRPRYRYEIALVTHPV